MPRGPCLQNSGVTLLISLSLSSAMIQEVGRLWAYPRHGGFTTSLSPGDLGTFIYPAAVMVPWEGAQPTAAPAMLLRTQSCPVRWAGFCSPVNTLSASCWYQGSFLVRAMTAGQQDKCSHALDHVCSTVHFRAGINTLVYPVCSSTSISHW